MKLNNMPEYKKKELVIKKALSVAPENWYTSSPFSPIGSLTHEATIDEYTIYFGEQYGRGDHYFWIRIFKSAVMSYTGNAFGNNNSIEIHVTQKDEEQYNLVQDLWSRICWQRTTLRAEEENSFMEWLEK